MKLRAEDAAYCAAAWASGEKQKDLATAFGKKSPVSVSLAIRAFLNAYADRGEVRQQSIGPRIQLRDDPLYDGMIYGAARKALVPGALRNFRRIRGN